MSRYRIGAEIGHGGLAVVHHGLRRLADERMQPLAIKRLRPDCKSPEVARKRLDLEAAVGFALSHPHIVKTYDYRRFGPDRGLVMERVNGVSLFALARHQRLPHDVVCLVLVDVAMALGYVHGEGILHRDVSPGNILLSRTGQVKLADFGLARVAAQPTTSDGFKGTPPYASPEAIRGQELDPGADLYSLAAVAYELLAGEPPYGRGHADEIARRQDPASGWQMPPLPEDVPPMLRMALTDLLRPREQRKICSADVLCELFANWTGYTASKKQLAALVDAAREQATTHERDAPSKRRSRWPLHTIITFGFLLAVGLGVVWQAVEAQGLAAGNTGGDDPVVAPAGVERPARALPETVGPVAENASAVQPPARSGPADMVELAGSGEPGYVPETVAPEDAASQAPAGSAQAMTGQHAAGRPAARRDRGIVSYPVGGAGAL